MSWLSRSRALGAIAVAFLAITATAFIGRHDDTLRVRWSYRHGTAGVFRLYRGFDVLSLVPIAEFRADKQGRLEVPAAGTRTERWIYQLRFVAEGGLETVLGTVAWAPARIGDPIVATAPGHSHDANISIAATAAQLQNAGWRPLFPTPRSGSLGEPPPTPPPKTACV